MGWGRKKQAGKMRARKAQAKKKAKVKSKIAAAKKNNVKLMIGHVERFNPATPKKALDEMVDADRTADSA